MEQALAVTKAQMEQGLLNNSADKSTSSAQQGVLEPGGPLHWLADRCDLTVKGPPCPQNSP